MGKLIAAAALTATVITGCASAAGSQAQRPPGWTAHPKPPLEASHWMCFNGVCYHLDGQGDAYGPPIVGPQAN